MRKRLPFLLLALLAFASTAQAQYFGRNKVQWEHFHFRVLQTEHFDIYYYDQEEDVVNDVGRMAERWYARLSRVFNHSFNRKPIVLYANSADFQQTTTTTELIGEGTGGFTDEFMNRVVLPLTGDYAENDHVLGHELVHVFQYDIARALSDSRRRFALEMMPLWLVEGMAEYFSKGRIDPLTAMWVRNASISDRMPDLRKLTNDPRYFPYRYGQALLAYIGGRFGDDAVVRYFLAAGSGGIDSAFDRALGISSKQLFNDWIEAAREQYQPVIQDRTATAGSLLVGSKKGVRGSLNVGPAYSPDGNYVALLSTHDIFDIDLFLADARTGQIIRKLVSSSSNAHFDAIRFIDSAGSWSPDSKKLAFIVFEKGDNYLGLCDVDTRHVESIRVPGIDAINSVSWSPDGRSVALSAQKTGVSDLFIYDLNDKSVRQLTNDKYADMQPAWSPDGRQIAFVSDRGTGTALDLLRFQDMRISIVDLDAAKIRTLPLFENAKHVNPQWAPDGQSIYFLANPDGVPDIYRYYFTDNRITRVTHVQTGVAGITELSPALSVSQKTGNLAFSLFEDDNYNIYTLPATASGPVVESTKTAEAPRAAALPPFRATGSLITAYLAKPEEGLPPESTHFREGRNSSSLHLAYLGPPTIGVTVGGGGYGSGVGGSVAAEYTDVLGEHNVGFTLQGGGTSGVGTFADQIGGEVFYLNQQHRFNWGADFTHLPYVGVATAVGTTVVNVNGQQVPADVIQQERDIIRYDDFSGLAQYPFNTTQRIEGQVGFLHQSIKSDLETLILVGNEIFSDDVQHLGNNLSINLVHASGAFVGDTSIFGFVSPVRGSRYRVEAGTYSGDLKFQTALIDYRKYFFFRPITFAVRGLHYGRYGSDAEDNRLSPLYLGDYDLVRGYEAGSIGLSECGKQPVGSNACPVFDRLIGSRVAVVNTEVRVPLFGTKEFGVFSGFLPTELMFFADGGAAWNQGQHPKITFNTHPTETRVPVYSAGAGARILLAYIPVELYYAKPFQRPDKGWVFGFNILPGW